MNIENYIIEATELVLAWELPDEELGAAIQAQAELMAGGATTEQFLEPSLQP